MFTDAAEAQIAKRIEDRLAATGITRKSLHDMAGLSRSTFDRCMAGGRSFSINELIRIADVLGSSVGDLLPEALKLTTAAA